MMEKLPSAVGRALRGVRSSLEKTAYFGPFIGFAPETLSLTSSAFRGDGTLPAAYTGDGRKISPPLKWEGVPPGAQSLVLIVEDPDAPAPGPITHALVLDLPAADGELAEGALPSPGARGGIYTLGRNCFGKAQYQPPDPPPGHGPHRYLFQLYALDQKTGLGEEASLGDVVDAIERHVIAKGSLVATYERA